MNSSVENDIEVWEGEGGATPAPPGARAISINGTANLEEKRAEVTRTEQAGYFLHDWQDNSDQVRQMIFQDARSQAIKSNRPARRR